MDSVILVLPAFNAKHCLSLCSYQHSLCRKNIGKHQSPRKRLASMRIRCEKRQCSSNEIDRRRMLLASSSLGMAALTAGKADAEDHYFPSPDLSKCSYPARMPSGVMLSDSCCPPYIPGVSPVNFEFPSRSSPMRERKAAHLLDEREIARYDAALKLMKALDPRDPRSFSQQAKIHCAYCNNTFSEGHDAHGTWFFAPFHRWYLYFYERILGSLIGDDTFALPFWNWDHELGMSFPAIYTDKTLSLYDENRDPCHQPPKLFNINHSLSCDTGSVESNYAAIYTTMNAQTKRLFHGSPVRYKPDTLELKSKGSKGSLESSPHNYVHDWTGSRQKPHRENMGTLYSAARDPLFYSHHCNVDRMWALWNDKFHHTNYTDLDLKLSKFVFYDEKKQLVQVDAGGCYDINKLRYQYQDVDLPWQQGRSIKKANKLIPKPSAITFRDAITRYKEVEDKVKLLISPVTVPVMRPFQHRTLKQISEEEEVLSIEGIELNMDENQNFSIFINYPEANSNTSFDSRHYAGSFASLGHGMSSIKSNSKLMSYKVGISETLEDIGADGDDTVLVTLVPGDSVYHPNTPIKFTSIKIEYDIK